MNIIIKYALLSALFFVFSATFSQTTNYPIKKMNGNEYYIYTIQSGEGLYAISKRFNVTQAEINKLNPQLAEGLKSGQEIIIPKKNTTTTSVSKSESKINEATTDSDYILHTVERRQTLFAICRQYGVTREAVINANPIIKSRNIQYGDVLKIPTTKNNTQTSEKGKSNLKESTSRTQNKSYYLTHKVGKGETLYSISKKYNVTVDDIKNKNPETASVLKTGAVLKIPTDGNNKKGASAANIKKKEAKTTYRIAYLLPFSLGKKDPTIEKFIEFYMGSLLAINNNKNGPLKYEIYTYDIEKSESKVYEVINKPEMQTMDIIIGPAYTTQVQILADFAKRRKIYTIVPFTSKIANIETNPYILQFNPSSEIQTNYLIDILKGNFRSYNIVLASTSDPNRDNSYFETIKQQLDSKNINTTAVNLSDNEDWNSILVPNRRNLILFDTDNYSSTIKAELEKLHHLSPIYDVAVMGQYSWRNQNGEKPKMFYISPFSGKKQGTHFYETEYHKYYGNKSPYINPRFDLLGYDLTTFLISTMHSDGLKFNSTTQTLNFNRGVQSEFRFIRVGDKGGFVNNQLYLIEDEAN